MHFFSSRFFSHLCVANFFLHLWVWGICHISGSEIFVTCLPRPCCFWMGLSPTVCFLYLFNHVTSCWHCRVGIVNKRNNATDIPIFCCPLWTPLAVDTSCSIGQYILFQNLTLMSTKFRKNTWSWVRQNNEVRSEISSFFKCQSWLFEICPGFPSLSSDHSERVWGRYWKQT